MLMILLTPAVPSAQLGLLSGFIQPVVTLTAWPLFKAQNEREQPSLDMMKAQRVRSERPTSSDGSSLH